MKQSILIPTLAALGGALVGLLIGLGIHERPAPESPGLTSQPVSLTLDQTDKVDMKVSPPSPADRVSIPVETPAEDDLELEPAALVQQEGFFDGVDYEASKDAYAFPWSAWSGSLPKTEPVLFEAKYGNLSLMEIRKAKSELEFELGIVREDLFAKRQENGYSIVQDVQYQTAPDGSLKTVPPAVKFVGDTPCFQIARRKDANGDPYFEFDWLPPNEYPEFYEQFNEVAWLVGKEGKLMAAAQKKNQ